MFDQNSPHGLGRSGKEMAAAVEAGRGAVAGPEESQIGLVHEGRCLERVLAVLLGHFAAGQSPKLLIDERQQAARCLRIALLDGRKDDGDFVHSFSIPRRRSNRTARCGRDARRNNAKRGMENRE